MPVRAQTVAAVATALAVLAAGCSHGRKAPPVVPTSVPGTTTTTAGPPPGNTASAPGVTPAQITIGTHQPLTGTQAPGLSEIAPAANAYFQFVNEHGGVHGRSIVLKAMDDEGDPAATPGAVRQLLQAGVFAIVDGRGVATHRAVVAALTAQRIPDLFVGSSCTCWNAPTTDPLRFGFAPDFQIEGAVQGDYIARVLAGRKVGYLVPADGSGVDAATGLDRHVPKSSVVSRQAFDPTTTSVKAQVLALQAAGAQVVALYSPPVVTAEAMLAAVDAGYRPTWVVSNSGSDVTTVTGLLQTLSKGAAGGSLLEGAVTDAYLAPIGDATNPWTQLWRRVHDAYAPKLPLDGNVAYGMAMAYTFVQAALAAGQNPTRAGIVSAIAHVPFAGPGLVPFGYGAASHAGYTGVAMGSIVLGQFKALEPPRTVGPSGALQVVPSQPAVPPASGIPTAATS